jgi:hypothetical protein
MKFVVFAVVFALIACAILLNAATAPKAVAAWTFVVSGDSRNCGDLIMPVIAARSKAARARFYWHLGDLRALYQMDQDYAGFHRKELSALTMDAYLKDAWTDFEHNQVAPFAPLGFFLGIGNHETVGRTEDQFVMQFRKLLDSDPIRHQREIDKFSDGMVHPYYHWREPGTDLINLDNAFGVFDQAQVDWIMKVIAADEADPDVKVLLVGMHESLPDSYSLDHSMNEGSDKGTSGRAVYHRLLDFRQKTGKAVHVFSSHSHYYLENIYNTGMWQSNGGVLPGTLIGTAGAQHYAVPPEVKSFATFAENQYGFALVRVDPNAGARAVDVRFVPVKRQDLSAAAIEKFGRDAVDFCFSQNWRATLHEATY